MTRLEYAKKIEADVSNFVSAFYHESNLTVKDYATSANLNVRTVQRVLKLAETSWLTILTEARTRKARDMMARTDKAVDEVAEMVGYKDKRTLIRNYKRRYGQTPMQTRREARGVR